MKSRSETIITYEPDNSLKKEYPSIFIEIFNEIKNNRWLICQLFRRDLLVLYRQSFVGIFWVIIIPFVSMVTFILLHRSGIFTLGDIDIPYPVYALLGMAFWQFFSMGLIASSNALINAGAMIVKINFSKKSLCIASYAQVLVPFLVQLVLVVVLFFYYRFVPNITILLVPILIIPLVLFSLGLGFILSLLNGVMRDISNALSIIITFLMFLTPVLYAKPKVGILAQITNYNPLYYLVSVPRELVLTGRICEERGFLITSIIAVIVFILCLTIFHLSETRVAERI